MKKRGFDVQIFHDGFDDHVAWGQGFQGLGARDALLDGFGFTGGDPTFFNEAGKHFAQFFLAALQGVFRGIHQYHLASSLGCDLGDATSHGARTNDTHLVPCFHETKVMANSADAVRSSVCKKEGGAEGWGFSFWA